MKRKSYIYLGMSLFFFGMAGCATQANHVTPTPTTTIENNEPQITPEINRKLLEALKK